MNEMIPKPNTVPAEKSPDREKDVILDPEQYIVAEELVPNQPTIEALTEELNTELSKAADYDEVMKILEARVAQNSHQTVETALLAICSEDPTPDNLFYLDLFKDIAATNTVTSQESLIDPVFEKLAAVLEIINQYTEEDVKEVADITDPAVAESSPMQAKIRADIQPLYRIVCDMRWDSKVTLDADRTLYPDFWKMFDKFEAMHLAVGIINTIQKTVRHDLSVK